MLQVLARNWWLIALRGLVAVLFGAAAFAWPALTLLALVALFGAYALVDGAAAIVSAVRGADGGGRSWALLVEGLVGVAAGVWALAAPGLTALALLYVIAGWALVTGVLEIVAAIRLRDELEGEWMLATGGLLSALFGLYVAVFPAAALWRPPGSSAATRSSPASSCSGWASGCAARLPAPRPRRPPRRRS